MIFTYLSKMGVRNKLQRRIFQIAYLVCIHVCIMQTIINFQNTRVSKGRRNIICNMHAFTFTWVYDYDRFLGSIDLLELMTHIHGDPTIILIVIINLVN